MDCINPNVSLFDLISQEQKLKRELKEVRDKIKALNEIAQSGTGAIRIM